MENCPALCWNSQSSANIFTPFLGVCSGKGGRDITLGQILYDQLFPDLAADQPAPCC